MYMCRQKMKVAYWDSVDMDCAVCTLSIRTQTAETFADVSIYYTFNKKYELDESFHRASTCYYYNHILGNAF